MHYSPQTFHPPTKSSKVNQKQFFEPRSIFVSLKEKTRRESRKTYAIDLGEALMATSPQDGGGLQKSDESPYFTGTLILGQGCRLEDIRVIPGLDHEPLYTPTSRVISNVDGFWYRQRLDSWFKIPNGATVRVDCDENGKLTYQEIINVPFFSPEWVRGSRYPF